MVHGLLGYTHTYAHSDADACMHARTDVNEQGTAPHAAPRARACHLVGSLHGTALHLFFSCTSWPCNKRATVPVVSSVSSFRPL